MIGAQSLPLPDAPMVDLTTGAPSQQWYRVLMNLQARTGGASGTQTGPGTLASVVVASVDQSEAILLALLADVTGDAASAAPSAPPDAAALLALLLADVPVFDALPDPAQATLLSLALSD